MAQTRYRLIAYWTLLAVVWGAAVLLVLSFREIRGDWDHAVCGVWGCSPPVAAVLSCQGVWGLVLFPLSYWSHRSFAPRVRRIIANTLLAVSFVALIGIVIYEYFHWYLYVGPNLRRFMGHRLALATLTQVDFPVVLLFVSGLLMRFFAAGKGKPLNGPSSYGEEHDTSDHKVGLLPQNAVDQILRQID